MFAPSSTVLVALLTALLGGSILLNVKEEIPSERGSSFGWFVTGLILYAGLLALVTALAEYQMRRIPQVSRWKLLGLARAENSPVYGRSAPSPC